MPPELSSKREQEHSYLDKATAVKVHFDVYGMSFVLRVAVGIRKDVIFGLMLIYNAK
jgi:tRNA splicing endonuclease